MLCRTLVADALALVGHESQSLLGLRGERSALGRGLAQLALGALHRRRAGQTFVSLLRACSTQIDFYLEPPTINAA